MRVIEMEKWERRKEVKRKKRREGSEKREVRIQLNAHIWEAPTEGARLPFFFFVLLSFFYKPEILSDTDVKTERDRHRNRERFRGPLLSKCTRNIHSRRPFHICDWLRGCQSPGWESLPGG